MHSSQPSEEVPKESESSHAYGEKNLLEETSRALDQAAGNQEQSPMVVVMASNRSNGSGQASRRILSQRDPSARQDLASGRQRSSRSQRRANRKDNEAAEAYDQKSSSGDFSYKTPRVLQLPSTDRSCGQGADASGGNNVALND